MSEPIGIKSPSQTYDGRYLPPASECGSVLRVPVKDDWAIQAEIEATLYGNVSIQVVTLYRQRFINRNDPDWIRTYYLWTVGIDGKTPCPIENLCDECRGSGRYFDSMDRYPAEPCGYCDGRGWFYAD